MLESFNQNSECATDLTSQRLSTEAFDRSLQAQQIQSTRVRTEHPSTDQDWTTGDPERLSIPNEAFVLTAQDLENLYWHQASSCMRNGNFDLAEETYRKLLKLEEDVHGKNSKEVAVACICLGISIERQDRSADAEPYFDRAVQILRNIEGPNGRTLGIALREQGINFIHGEKYPEAEVALTESLKIAQEIDPKGRYTAWTMSDLAVAQTYLGKYTEAENGFKTAIKMIESDPDCGPKDQSLIPILQEYAQLLQKMGKGEEASAVLQRAQAIAGNA